MQSNQGASYVIYTETMATALLCPWQKNFAIIYLHVNTADDVRGQNRGVTDSDGIIIAKMPIQHVNLAYLLWALLAQSNARELYRHDVLVYYFLL